MNNQKDQESRSEVLKKAEISQQEFADYLLNYKKSSKSPDYTSFLIQGFEQLKKNNIKDLTPS
jgi:hypothetical protein